MSVTVNQLTKIYGQQTAVNSISFELRKGEITGFLGPNGARAGFARFRCRQRRGRNSLRLVSQR